MVCLACDLQKQLHNAKAIRIGHFKRADRESQSVKIEQLFTYIRSHGLVDGAPPVKKSVSRMVILMKSFGFSKKQPK
jgi:hypothetical protein